MSLWSRFFGSSYDDEKLTSTIQTVMTEDPLVSDPARIRVTSEDGVITLTGSVDKVLEKDHIEGAVRDAIKYNGLKFAQIVNDIQVESRAAVT